MSTSLLSGTPITSIKIDKVFIASRTNSRISDLRSAASMLRGRRITPHIHAIVVPGSGLIKGRAEEEDLDVVFRRAGFETWREAGCSMCSIGINEDRLKHRERLVIGVLRGENLQGPGGRTHFMSPPVAAAKYCC
jgi:homoaconitase/3-isopropylmalate dehydratase large subunit